MKRADKIQKRKDRAQRRRAKRNEAYKNRIRACDELGGNVPLSAARRLYGGQWYVMGSWPDPSSPTGYSQKCSYDVWGTCQSPCNGDC
jgi:hypothetical protein